MPVGLPVPSTAAHLDLSTSTVLTMSSYVIDSVTLDFTNEQSVIRYHEVFDDDSKKYGETTISGSTDFSTFYETYTNHASLYTQFATKLSLVGDYASE